MHRAACIWAFRKWIILWFRFVERQTVTRIDAAKWRTQQCKSENPLLNKWKLKWRKKDTGKKQRLQSLLFRVELNWGRKTLEKYNSLQLEYVEFYFQLNFICIFMRCSEAKSRKQQFIGSIRMDLVDIWIRFSMSLVDIAI